MGAALYEQMMIMKGMILTCMFCFAVLLAQAQQRYALSGTVRIGEAAAANATVSLQPEGLQRITNENGYFRFSRLAAGG